MFDYSKYFIDIKNAIQGLQTPYNPNMGRVEYQLINTWGLDLARTTDNVAVCQLDGYIEQDGQTKKITFELYGPTSGQYQLIDKTWCSMLFTFHDGSWRLHTVASAKPRTNTIRIHYKFY